ncbi:MAG: Helix-turn-helix domain, partial [Solirubrobacteraceae bacterium]|nr:Helix-turn-helix domain [Solirubrobacteraceae bacterium]
MSILGDHLRAARLRHGVSQRSLARRAGTTQTAVSRIESGRESPSYERFESLLLVLGERPRLVIEPLRLDVDLDALRHGRRLTPQ